MNALYKDYVMAGAKTVITETISTSPKYLSNKIYKAKVCLFFYLIFAQSEPRTLLVRFV